MEESHKVLVHCPTDDQLYCARFFDYNAFNHTVQVMYSGEGNGSERASVNANDVYNRRGSNDDNTDSDGEEFNSSGSGGGRKGKEKGKASGHKRKVINADMPGQRRSTRSCKVSSSSSSSSTSSSSSSSSTSSSNTRSRRGGPVLTQKNCTCTEILLATDLQQGRWLNVDNVHCYREGRGTCLGDSITDTFYACANGSCKRRYYLCTGCYNDPHYH